MSIRKVPLKNEIFYHIFSRSIAKFEIFNDTDDYLRFFEILDLYRFLEFKYKYSQFNALSEKEKDNVLSNLSQEKVLIDIVAYCIMPTHFHLILKQIVDNGISKYIGKALNSYTRYFNLRHHRTGPLWEGKFKNVLIEDDDQILHLTRYIHLNPTSAGLVKKPNDWAFSSYQEFINPNLNGKICNHKEIINLSPKQYQKFTLDRQSYQKDLSAIKDIIIDNYTG